MTINNIILPKIKNSSIPEHLAFWLFMFLFIFDYHFEIDNWIGAAITTLTELGTYATIVYINLYICIPIVLKKSKILYVFSLIVLVITYIFFIKLSGLESELYETFGWRSIFSMILNAILFLFISYLYWYFKQWNLERERQLILKGEKNEAELKFLKTQISPHFIFNTLNNIYSLALTNHINTAPMVAKLSGILRYVLYEASEQNVLLKNEWDMVKQYIDLFLLKKPKSQNIDIFIDGDASDYRIAPMILVNLVENVWKHSGLEHDENAWAKINLEINSNGIMIFITENTSKSVVEKTSASGIGLQNLKRQMDIAYPDNHRLDIEQRGDIYQVKLQIQLTKR